MHHTFELYVRLPGGQRRFTALTCRPYEMVAKARRVLSEAGGTEVEVHQAGAHLFTLAVSEGG